MYMYVVEYFYSLPKEVHLGGKKTWHITKESAMKEFNKLLKEAKDRPCWKNVNRKNIKEIVNKDGIIYSICMENECNREEIIIKAY